VERSVQEMRAEKAEALAVDTREKLALVAAGEEGMEMQAEGERGAGGGQENCVGGVGKRARVEVVVVEMSESLGVTAQSTVRASPRVGDLGRSMEKGVRIIGQEARTVRGNGGGCKGWPERKVG
jgi:hypothetical protein